MSFSPGSRSGRRPGVAFLLAPMALAALALAVLLPSHPPEARAASPSAAVERGAYLVNAGGCNDCHTPWKMGANGPEPDMSLMLSGHPEKLTMPPAPVLTMPWSITAAATMTAWSGPWGVSYTANLTPDPETGLGKWTEDQFLMAIHSGRNLGRGRPILPPMPWPNLAKMPDDDLKAIFAYLQSIPPIRNRVPEPQAPASSPSH